MDLSVDLLGNSPGMVALRERVSRLLQRPFAPGRLPPILINGETGTGKGRLAQVIHRAGPRRTGPFIDVNCAAIPETLVESQMFGSERGAFTDARQPKLGLFRAANGGILFLDEVGLLSEAFQAKLLKVIEDRQIRALGATRSVPVDVWIIAATNADLEDATRQHRFRHDLYHRLNVLSLRLPPLRERGDDVVLLADHFLARACEDHGQPPLALAPNARAALLAYDWPGNVRELSNVIERVAAFAEAPLVTAEMLGLPAPAGAAPFAVAAPDVVMGDVDAPEADERQQLLQALSETGWNVSRAAARLALTRNAIRYRIEKYRLSPGAPSPRIPVAAARAGAPAREPSPAPAAGPEGVAPVPGPSAVRWERRRVTLLRAALAAPDGAEDFAFGSRGTEMVVEKVQSFGGRVEELSPTSVVAAFGLDPVEDAPLHAAHAAMAIQKAAERAGRDEGEVAVIRVAIHVGLFLVGQVGGAAQIDLQAKREAWGAIEALESQAAPNSIIASEAAQPFLKRRFELVTADGSGGPFGPAYRLAGRAKNPLAVGGRAGEFVGRRQDLDLLGNRLASAMAGRGQFVGIVGEAGIGKSRLVLEFRQSLPAKQVTYLEGHCLSYGSAVPYLPMLEMLKQGFGITGVHGAGTIRDRVRTALQALAMEPDEWMPLFLHLLGVQTGGDLLTSLSPEAIKAKTVEGFRQILLRGCRLRPMIIVLEDLHWIDHTSEECVGALVEILGGSRILFVASYRPGYRPPWMDRSYATQVPIQPLSVDDSLTVVRSVLRSDQVPAPLTRLILDKADGNPFFLEELSRAVGEHGSLQKTLAVPDTIQEVLLARIHRLPEETKTVLQTAAVLGREVPSRLLETIWRGPGALEPELRRLMQLEFVFQRPGGPEPVYVFKHALTQEVAYESLAAPRRQALHTAAGEALERLYAGRLDDGYEQLAYHFARTDQAERAIDYLTRFARKAAALFAHEEAVRALQEARGHVKRLPADQRDRRRLELVLGQASSFFPLGRIRELLDLLLPERGPLEHLKDPALAGEYYFMLGRAYSFLAEHRRAAESAQRAIEEADRGADGVLKGKALCLLAQDAPFLGRAREGIEEGRQAVDLLQNTREHWWLASAHWVVGLNYGQIGEFRSGLDALGRAAAIAEATADPLQRTVVAWGAGILHAVMGEVDRGVEECQRAFDRAPDPLNRAIAGGWLGLAHLQRGDADRAITVLEPAVAQLSQWGYRALQSWFRVFLAEAFRVRGDIDRAFELASLALQIGNDAGIAVVAGWARHSLGRIAQARGALAEAEDYLNEALDTFESIRSRYEYACTKLDLAVVHHLNRRPRAAAAHAREAHQLFTVLAVPYHAKRAEAIAASFAVPL